MSAFRTLALFCTVALLLLGATVAPAQDVKVVVAEGMGAARDNLRARDDAIQDALRRAVEQGVGTLVDAGTLTKNYELVADKVLSVAAGYVRTYEILDERREGDILRIRIRAEVAMAQLNEDLVALELLKQRLGYPRVMVVGVERADAQEISSNSVAVSIENFLITKGFDLVDKSTIEAGKARDVALNFDDYSAAQALGQRYGAEVLVTYQADADYSGGDVIYGTQFERYRGQVNVRVIKVDTAALMASVGSTDMGAAGGRLAGARKALENAGAKAAPSVFQKIVDTWQADVEGGTRLELVIQGVDFKTSNSIYLDLQEMRGVTSVGNPQMVRDTVTIQLKGDIQGFGLAQRISTQFPNLEIEEVTQNRVKVRGGGGAGAAGVAPPSQQVQ